MNEIDKVITRIPVNRTAAIVTAKGVHFESKKIVLTNDSAMPIQIRQINRAERNAQGFVDLTGVRFGRFTVIGIAKRHRGHWVVRCVCGTYTTRKSKAIKNPRNHADACEMCQQIIYLRTAKGGAA